MSKVPSSSTTGFFQSPPEVQPQLTEDSSLARILTLYLPLPVPAALWKELKTLSETCVSPQTSSLLTDAESHPPTLHPLTDFGSINSQSALRTSEGWRRLQDMGIEQGMVASGYSPGDCLHNRRLVQYLKHHLWSSSSATVTCPSAMTDGAAKLLGKHLDDPEGGDVFRKVRDRLISTDPAVAWTSGQWMTERRGGSDVSGTETVAERLGDPSEDQDAHGMPLGPWSISGFKWFSSATDAHCSVMLAQTEKGLSAFYAPMRRKTQSGGIEMNGVRIQRLKNKMGTKALPTAELELVGMRGYLVGVEGRGINELANILNITRLHTAVAALSYWARGLAVSRAYARVRMVSRGKLLASVAAHTSWMAQEHVKYRAAMHLTFFVASLLGSSEQGPIAIEKTAAREIMPTATAEVEALLRLLTPLMKARVSLASNHGLRACVESLGGLGYLENDNAMLNVARLYRDCAVQSIWEGTTNVMADDVVRVVKGNSGQQTLAILENWLQGILNLPQEHEFQKEASELQAGLQSFLRETSSSDAERLRADGWTMLEHLEGVVCGSLLIADAARDGNVIAIESARRWVRDFVRTPKLDEKVEGSHDLDAAIFGVQMRSSKL